MLAIFKSRMTSQNKIIDIESDTAADFSIMVTYLPKSATEADIRTFFESEIKGVEISEVSFTYNIDTLITLEHEKDLLYQILVNMVVFCELE